MYYTISWRMGQSFLCSRAADCGPSILPHLLFSVLCSLCFALFPPHAFCWLPAPCVLLASCILPAARALRLAGHLAFCPNLASCPPHAFCRLPAPCVLSTSCILPAAGTLRFARPLRFARALRLARTLRLAGHLAEGTQALQTGQDDSPTAELS